MSGELIPFVDIERMGSAIAKSGLFGIRTPEQAIALMLVAQSEGIHPAAAARDYHVIQGRPALKADAMLARFQQAGGKVEWTDYTDKLVAATFSHPQGGSIHISWDITRAEMAGLGTKDNWKKYPRQMLRARVISEGIRTVYPGVSVGIYTPEEVEDFDSKPEQTTSNYKEQTRFQEAKYQDVTEAEVSNIVGQFTEPAPLPESIKKQDEPSIISAAQRKRMFAIANECGVHTSDLRVIIGDFGFESSKLITTDKYDAICQKIEETKKGASE